MAYPAGLYKGVNYLVLTQAQVDQLDSTLPSNTGFTTSQILDSLLPTGSIGSARFNMSVQPATSNVISIGDDTYQFRAAAASVLNDAFIAVAIGATAALTAANLVAAINGTYAGDLHPTIFRTNGTTPAHANGTKRVFADLAGTAIRVRNADAVGGNPVVGTQDLALAEIVTDPADIWDQANLSATGGNRSPRRSQGQVVVDATNVLTTFHVELPFIPSLIIAKAYTTGGVEKANSAVVLAAAGERQFAVQPGAGGTPLVATDVIRWVAFE